MSQQQFPDFGGQGSGGPVFTEVDVPERSPHFIPWITVGAIAVVAIVVSIVLVTVFRGAPAPETDTPTTGQDESSEVSEAPTVQEPPAKEEPKVDDNSGAPVVVGDAPKVDMGSNAVEVEIGPWKVKAKFAAKFGYFEFTVPEPNTLLLTSPWFDEFPDSCKDMRTQFGITKIDDNTYEVKRPAQTCAAAPELYDEVWGQIAATIKTFKPIS